jgi:quercetin dioxygenase-like cupin family protein
MTDIKRTLNRPGRQLHSYSIPVDGHYAATAAISAKPVDHSSPPTNTNFEETRLAASGGERSKKLFWLAGVFAFIISPLHAQERKEVTITPLLSSTVTSSGQPIVLPQKNAEVVVSIYDVAPGTALPVHKHPYPMYAYVLFGNLRVTNTETGRSDTYKPGDFILESVGQWHLGVNIGSEPLRLLVINIAEKGQSNTVLQRQSPPLRQPIR